MLLDLTRMVQHLRLNIKGVIHAGAHHGQEYGDYVKNNIRNIIFIEPCKEAFDVLNGKYKGKATLFNCAIGSKDHYAVMNVEKANTGMSNSLLQPKKHLEQYPDIQFISKERVKVRQLDNLYFKRANYNFLMMDIQGYELEALKGAQKTLQFIDYIYTEVNNDEVYKGCARVEQLDAFLSDFERVYTDWGGITWGDAIYIRRKSSHKSIIDVPAEFRPHLNTPYPPDNVLIFEEWYYQNIAELSKKRSYLPVFWTSFYVNKEFGMNKIAMRNLQSFIDGLDKAKKYYTIVQYDDGILSDISKLDIKVFSMSGARKDYVLPLLCSPHTFTFPANKRIWLANFVGRRTHLYRNFIFDQLKNKIGWYVSEQSHQLKDYCQIIAQSIFTLCPRGYGATSFRIAEALQYGSIPVYISNEFMLPHQDKIKFTDYGVIIKEKDIKNIQKILEDIPKSVISKKQKMLTYVYENYYTYKANKRIITENL